MSEDGSNSSSSSGIIFDRVSVKSVGILFASCVTVLFLLVICRTVINIIIIDVCILGDCTAWRKLCSCCGRGGRRNEHLHTRGHGQGRRQGQGQGQGDYDTNGMDVEHNDNSTDGSNNGIGWREAFRRAGIALATSTNPVSYLYSRPEEQRNTFLESIIDSQVRMFMCNVYITR